MIRPVLIKGILMIFFSCLTMFVEGIPAQQLMTDNFSDSPYYIYDTEIEELMEVAKPSWFGAQLEELTFEPYVLGYTDIVFRNYGLNPGRSAATFNLPYFNIVVGTDVNDKITAEVFMEYDQANLEVAPDMIEKCYRFLSSTI